MGESVAFGLLSDAASVKPSSSVELSSVVLSLSKHGTAAGAPIEVLDGVHTYV